MTRRFPSGSDGEESACNSGDPGLLPESGRSSGEGNRCPLHCSRLENSMDREAWRVIVHGAAKSWTRLSDSETHSESILRFLEGIKMNDREEYSTLGKRSYFLNKNTHAVILVDYFNETTLECPKAPGFLWPIRDGWQQSDSFWTFLH